MRTYFGSTGLTIMAIVSVLLCRPALAAGGMEGGGGKSVICRNADGTIRSAEVLDLYEGRTIYQLTYQESSDPWRQQAEQILEKAGLPVWKMTSPPSSVQDWYRNAVQHLVILPEGTALKPIDDSLEAIIPSGCALEQTANYQNDARILIDGSHWKALTETQKAALVIHESVYRVLRSHGETNSRRARHLTAHILSGNRVEDVYPGNGYDLICQGGDKKSATYFYVVKQPMPSDGSAQKVRLYFGAFGGRVLMSRSYSELNLSFGIPVTTLVDQLRNPTVNIGFQNLNTISKFEGGDTFMLSIRNWDGHPTIRLEGTSIVDGSHVGPMEISCF